MQTKAMWQSTKWKVVAGAATLTAVGIGGMAMADSDDPALPKAINLQDRVATSDTLPTLPDFVVTPNNQIDLTDLDSPFSDDEFAGSSITVDEASTDTGREDAPGTRQAPADLDTASTAEPGNPSTTAPANIISASPEAPVDLDTASPEGPLNSSTPAGTTTSGPVTNPPGAASTPVDDSVDSAPLVADGSADS